MKRLFVLIIAAMTSVMAMGAQNFELGFSPGGSSLKVVLDSIASAKSSILVACYEFTSRDIEIGRAHV